MGDGLDVCSRRLDFLSFLAVAAVAGALLAVIGNRYPMIYRQNR